MLLLCQAVLAALWMRSGSAFCPSQPTPVTLGRRLAAQPLFTSSRTRQQVTKAEWSAAQVAQRRRFHDLIQSTRRWDDATSLLATFLEEAAAPATMVDHGDHAGFEREEVMVAAPPNSYTLNLMLKAAVTTSTSSSSSSSSSQLDRLGFNDCDDNNFNRQRREQPLRSPIGGGPTEGRSGVKAVRVAWVWDKLAAAPNTTPWVPSSLGDPSSTSSTESTSSSSLVKCCQPDTISLNTMLKQWFRDNSSPASASTSAIVPSPSLASSPQAAADAAVVGSGDIVGSDDLAQAEALVSKLGKLHGVVPDATTVNSLIQIACQPRSTKSTGNLGSHLHHEFHWAPHASGLMGRAEAYVRLLERAHDGAWLARDDAKNGGLEELDIEGERHGNGDVSLLEDRRGGGESVGATADFCLLFEESSPSFSCNEISDSGGNEGGSSSSSSSSSVDDPRSKRMKMTRLTRQGRKWWREVQFSLEESLLSPEKKAPRSFSRHHSSPAAQQQKSQRSHKQKQLKKKKKTEQQGEGQQQHKQLAVAYTSLLVGYARSGDLKSAVDVFARRMPSRGISPTTFTVTAMANILFDFFAASHTTAAAAATATTAPSVNNNNSTYVNAVRTAALKDGLRLLDATAAAVLAVSSPLPQNQHLMLKRAPDEFLFFFDPFLMAALGLDNVSLDTVSAEKMEDDTSERRLGGHSSNVGGIDVGIDGESGTGVDLLKAVAVNAGSGLGVRGVGQQQLTGSQQVDAAAALTAVDRSFFNVCLKGRRLVGDVNGALALLKNIAAAPPPTAAKPRSQNVPRSSPLLTSTTSFSAGAAKRATNPVAGAGDYQLWRDAQQSYLKVARGTKSNGVGSSSSSDQSHTGQNRNGAGGDVSEEKGLTVESNASKRARWLAMSAQERNRAVTSLRRHEATAVKAAAALTSVSYATADQGDKQQQQPLLQQVSTQDETTQKDERTTLDATKPASFSNQPALDALASLVGVGIDEVSVLTTVRACTDAATAIGRPLDDAIAVINSYLRFPSQPRLAPTTNSSTATTANINSPRSTTTYPLATARCINPILHALTLGAAYPQTSPLLRSINDDDNGDDRSSAGKSSKINKRKGNTAFPTPQAIEAAAGAAAGLKEEVGMCSSMAAAWKLCDEMMMATSVTPDACTAQILMEGHLRAGEATRALATWHKFFGPSPSSYGSSSSTSSYPKTLPFLHPNTFACNAKLKALAAVCASLPPMSHTDTHSSAYDGAGTFHASKSQSERRAGQGGTQERTALQTVAGETKSRVEVLRAALKLVEEMSVGPTTSFASTNLFNIHCAPDTHTLNAALAACVAFVTSTSISSLTSTSKSLPSAATTTFSSPSTPPCAAAAKLSRLATTRTLALLEGVAGVSRDLATYHLLIKGEGMRGGGRDGLVRAFQIAQRASASSVTAATAASPSSTARTSSGTGDSDTGGGGGFVLTDRSYATLVAACLAFDQSRTSEQSQATATEEEEEARRRRGRSGLDESLALLEQGGFVTFALAPSPLTGSPLDDPSLAKLCLPSPTPQAFNQGPHTAAPCTTTTATPTIENPLEGTTTAAAAAAASVAAVYTLPRTPAGRSLYPPTLLRLLRALTNDNPHVSTTRTAMATTLTTADEGDVPAGLDTFLESSAHVSFSRSTKAPTSTSSSSSSSSHHHSHCKQVMLLRLCQAVDVLGCQLPRPPPPPSPPKLPSSMGVEATAAADCYIVVADACIRLGQPNILRLVLAAAASAGVSLRSRMTTLSSNLDDDGSGVELWGGKSAASSFAVAATAVKGRIQQSMRKSIGRRLTAGIKAKYLKDQEKEARGDQKGK